ncbi:MAG TPA: F0F1 ATP synthase subunit B [Spirochaetota bacterium]|nr:F0F1 ATP synthase subunit B [Spirochaetota bacterium]HPH02422.1 F0F1 ATP synthase subunit B [Spirochaetota bacterium]HPN82365.1 F0F1 ATP synthase subunit B [Spirochaetota bacterium]
MFTFEPGVAIWTLISFVIVLIVLSKFVLPPITKAIDERKNKISSDLEAADEAARKAERTSSDLTRRLAAIDREREELLAEARERARSRFEELEKETHAAMNEMRKQREAELAAESEQFLALTGHRINQLIISGCERVLRTGLTSEQQAQVLENRIREFEKMTRV